MGARRQAASGGAISAQSNQRYPHLLSGSFTGTNTRTFDVSMHLPV